MNPEWKTIILSRQSRQKRSLITGKKWYPMNESALYFSIIHSESFQTMVTLWDQLYIKSINRKADIFRKKLNGEIKDYILEKIARKNPGTITVLTEKLWQETRVLVWRDTSLWLVPIFSDCSIVLWANQKAALRGQYKSKYYSRLSGL